MDLELPALSSQPGAKHSDHPKVILPIMGDPLPEGGSAGRWCTERGFNPGFTKHLFMGMLWVWGTSDTGQKAVTVT